MVIRDPNVALPALVGASAWVVMSDALAATKNAAQAMADTGVYGDSLKVLSGSADHTDINLAIDAVANDGHVVFSEGKASIDAAIDLHDGVSLYGEYRGTVIAPSADSFNAIEIVANSDFYEIVGLQIDFIVDAGASAGGGTGHGVVALGVTHNCNFENLLFRSPNRAFDMSTGSFFLATITNCRADSHTNFINATGGTTLNLINCYSNQAVGDAFVLGNVKDVNVYGGAADNGDNGFAFGDDGGTTGPEHLNITGFFHEGHVVSNTNTGGFVRMKGDTQVVMSGIHVNDCGAATGGVYMFVDANYFYTQKVFATDVDFNSMTTDGTVERIGRDSGSTSESAQSLVVLNGVELPSGIVDDVPTDLPFVEIRNGLYEIKNLTPDFQAGLRTQHSTDDVSNPPTDAELDSAFGTPSAVGAGFMATVDDNGGGSDFYLVASDGSNWWQQAMTKAT